MEVVAVVVEAAEVEAMVVVDMGEVVEVEATVRIIFCPQFNWCYPLIKFL